MSFLSIPLNVRLRIYAYTGLVRSCPIDVLQEGALKRQRDAEKECLNTSRVTRGFTIICAVRLDCHCPDIPVSIMRVCRQVYEEASAVLYGTNDLMFLCRSARDLRRIPQISKKAFSHVRSLLLRLNCWPCPRGHDLYACDRERTRCILCGLAVSDADALLSLQNDAGRRIIEQWTTTCTHLANALTPYQVHLSLIADVNGTREAQAIVTNLQRFPILKRLDIRLGRHREPALRGIASDTVRVLTNQYRHPGSCHYERLPEEIRLRILEFTGLAPAITSSDRVIKKSQRNESTLEPLEIGDGGRTHSYDEDRLQNWDGLASSEGPLYHDRSHTYRNRETSRNYGQPHDELFIRGNRISKSKFNNSEGNLCCHDCTLTASCCCCHDIYAASSAYCTCRRVPTDLFYASKTLHQDATKVFYSQNAFIFHQPLSLTFSFLRALAPPLLGLIQDITVKPILSTRIADNFSLAHAARDLSDVIGAMKGKVRLKTLSFTFDTRHYWHFGWWSEGYWEPLYAAHCKAARDMQALQGSRSLKFRGAKKAWDKALTRLAHGGTCTSFADLPPDDD